MKEEEKESILKKIKTEEAKEFAQGILETYKGYSGDITESLREKFDVLIRDYNNVCNIMKNKIMGK